MAVLGADDILIIGYLVHLAHSSPPGCRRGWCLSVCLGSLSRCRIQVELVTDVLTNYPNKEVAHGTVLIMSKRLSKHLSGPLRVVRPLRDRAHSRSKRVSLAPTSI